MTSTNAQPFALEEKAALKYRRLAIKAIASACLAGFNPGTALGAAFADPPGTLGAHYRRISLMVESTGLEPNAGHRIVEIAAAEILDGALSGRMFQTYLDPERAIDSGAESVHGLSHQFLAGKPRFLDVVDILREFVSNSEVVTHRAAFHIGFVDAELVRAGKPPLSATCPKISELFPMARVLFPGQRCDLNSLCDRLAIEPREIHPGDQARCVGAAFLKMDCRVKEK